MEGEEDAINKDMVIEESADKDQKCKDSKD